MAVGFNPATGIVTGYLSALYSAPGRADACKFVFRGALTASGTARLSIKDVVPENENGPASTMEGEFALLTTAKGKLRIDLPVSLAPGDCDWIIGMMEGPRVSTNGRTFVVTADTGPASDWVAVATIAAKRAFFHDAPDIRSIRKSFLVAGDVTDVTEEKPGWYRVRFTHAEKQTTGWIKISDTFQFQQSPK